jgi:hypothetical protein
MCYGQGLGYRGIQLGFVMDVVVRIGSVTKLVVKMGTGLVFCHVDGIMTGAGVGLHSGRGRSLGLSVVPGMGRGLTNRLHMSLYWR